METKEMVLLRLPKDLFKELTKKHAQLVVAGKADRVYTRNRFIIDLIEKALKETK
jgi:hypothetical protein